MASQHGVPEVAPSNQEHCQPCQHFHSAMAPTPIAQSTCGMDRETMLCGTARGGIGAQVAQQGSQETQRGALPHKTLGTEKHLHCIPFSAVTWSWETGVNPKTLLQMHLQCPLSNSTYSITAQRASASVRGKTQVPKVSQGSP